MSKTRSVLITGCSSGIGRCVALGLRDRGYRVFATARRRASVDELLDEGLESLCLDLSDNESITDATREIMERCDGQLYGLFNNGAYGQPGGVEDLTREVLRGQFETNLFGTHELTRQILPSMREHGEGRVIQNSSVLGLISLPFRGAYNASKYALEGLTDTLRLELRDTNIHVSLIEPGPIESRFRANAFVAYERNIDRDSSPHRDKYMAMEKRLTKQGAAAPFTLPPEAVLKRVIHALESPHPKPRYYVTFPTYLFGTCRRILPTSALDWLLHKVSVGEHR